MWRLAVVTVVLWNIITSQPITDDPQNGRHPRQLDFVHCCPCPSPDLPHLSPTGPAARAAADAGAGGGARAGPVDDCPCRAGSSDSQGASSVFFPRAVPRPFINMPDAQKGDQKPLLHPEVDLATSMLETLREVTDEEYQEALARDTARYAARVNELGNVEPETANNLVTIIVNPKSATDEDTVTPEASNVQETRCSHPSGTPNLGQVRDAPKFFEQPDLFDRNAFDMDDGASEAKESVVSLSKGLEGLKLKTTPSVLKLFPTKKNSEGNIQTLLKFKNDKLPKAAADSLNGSKINFGSNIPNLKLTPLFKKKEPVPMTPLKFDFKHLKLPTLRTNLGKKPKTSDAKNIDSSSSPSNLQEQLSKPIFDLKTLIPAPDPHFNLKNLQNLKDVELIPPKSNKPKIQIQGLELLTPSKSLTPSKPCKNKEKEIGKGDDVERSQKIQTDILDTIPNGSENHPVVSMSNEDIETPAAGLNDAAPVSQNTDIKTQILDIVPSASENIHIVVDSEHNKSLPTQPSTDILENTNAVRELEQHAVGEPLVQSDKSLSKDEEENMEDEDSSLELIVTGDEDTEIDAVEFIEETDQSDHNIGGVTFEDNGQSFDIDFIEDTSNINELGNESTVVEHNSEALGFGPEEDEMEDETSEDQLLFRKNNSSNEAELNVDSESINGDTHLVSEEDTEQRNFSDSDLRSDESQDEVAVLPNRNTDSVSSIKERISLKLETLKNPNKSKILTISRYSTPEKEDNSIASPASKDATDFAVFTEEPEHVLSDEKSAEMEVGASNRVTIQDLSKMSDSLLATSRSKGQNSQATSNEAKTSEDSSDRNIEDSTDSKIRHTEIINPERISSNMGSVATTSKAQIVNERFTIMDDNFMNNRGTEDNKFKKALEGEHAVHDSCPFHLEAKQDSSLGPKSAITDTTSDRNEMIPQASETKFRTAPGFAPFLQQSIVQPDSLFNPSSLLPPIAPLNVGDLNLPTLDELTSGLEGLLGGNARASNDDVKSSDLVSVEDCSEAQVGMATGASTNKAKSAFAPLKALEDLNLDIFQINPLSPEGLSSRMPSLNLNTFKTKLALPPSLDLKPLKLESALGRKNGGLLGASLTFGAEQRNREAVNKLSSILNKQGSDILGNPLRSMPSLEELRATMRANTQSLLKSPMIKRTFNPLEDTLRTSQALADSLRSHTENKMKNLQQSMALTLTDSRSKGANNGGNRLAKPQELVEMVSLAHEDMNDKLHAIHVDLQDRLSSIHDRILDQSNLPALKTPLLSLAKIEEQPKGTWRIAKPKNRSSNQAQGTHLTAKSKKVVAKNPTAKVNKPKNKDTNDMKPFKISKAASSLTPKSVEVPKLVITSPSTPQFIRPLQQDDSLKLRQPGSSFLNERPKAPQPKQFKHFGGLKITIATTPKPTTSNRENSRPSVHNEYSSGFKTLSKSVKSSKSFMDSRGFASEPKSSQVPAPVRPTTPILDSTEASEVRSSSSLPTPKPFVESRASPLASPKKEPSKIGPFKVSLPKPTESPFVTKMREAIKIHLSRPVQPKKLQHMDKLAKPIQSNDMRNAASEKNAVAIKPQTMKENVSYRCKMVCVRD